MRTRTFSTAVKHLLSKNLRIGAGLLPPGGFAKAGSSRNTAPMPHPTITAVLWDFGGVILSSPFDAFAAYEGANGLPEGLIRRLNAANPDTNAWAKYERSDVSFEEFCDLFEAEAAVIGHTVDARAVMGLLSGQVRPQMVEALHRLKAEGYKIACLTNNVRAAASPDEHDARPEVAAIMALFDHVTESSKAGIRKPEVRFYEMACEALGIEAHQAVFLDDLGINLKPAKAMGMRTIKVGDPDVALHELETILDLTLR